MFSHADGNPVLELVDQEVRDLRRQDRRFLQGAIVVGHEGITVGISLIGIVIFGTLVGSMLPLVLKRLNLDPATSSAPFVATLVDVTGIVIYFSVARCSASGILL